MRCALLFALMLALAGHAGAFTIPFTPPYAGPTVVTNVDAQYRVRIVGGVVLLNEYQTAIPANGILLCSTGVPWAWRRVQEGFTKRTYYASLDNHAYTESVLTADQVEARIVWRLNPEKC